MNYFHTDDPSTVEWLADVFAQAAKHGRKVRIKTDSHNQLQVKIGEGAWTAPLWSTFDPYREASPQHR